MTNKNRPVWGTRVLYIIISVIISLALWSYVEYVENPDVSVPITSVPITFENSDILEKNSLITTDISAKTLSFRATGKRNTVSKLSSDNVQVTVNLADLVSSYGATPGTYQLTYKIHYPETINSGGIIETGQSANYIAVHVERLSRVKVPVKGTFNGTVAEGFTSEPVAFNVDEITVSGPDEIVSQIDHAWVELNAGFEVTSTIEQEVGFALIDKNGKAVDMTHLKTDMSSVIVTLEVLTVKEVALTVNIADTSVSVKDNYTVKIEPKSIMLSGRPEDLEGINQIELGTVDLTSFSTTLTQSMAIAVPNGTTNLTGDTTANVVITVLGLDTKTVVCDNISTRNVPSNLNVTSITTQSVNVLLRGPAADLDKIDASNIHIIANLSELGNNSGTFSVDARVVIDGFTDIDAIGSYTVTVVVSNQ